MPGQFPLAIFLDIRVFPHLSAYQVYVLSYGLHSNSVCKNDVEDFLTMRTLGSQFLEF